MLAFFRYIAYISPTKGLRAINFSYMKKDIHPTYHRTKVTCASCNNEFELGSTMESMRVDTCYSCHSFYTGESAVSTKVGRAEKFAQRMKAAEAAQAGKSEAKKEEKKEEKADVTKMSLADLAAAVKGKPERGMMKTDVEDTQGSDVKVVKEATK